MNQNRYNMRKRKRKAKDDTSSDEVLFPQKEKKIQIKLEKSQVNDIKRKFPPNFKKIQIKLEKSQVNEIIRLMDTIHKKNELIRKICKEKNMLNHQLHVKEAQIESLVTEITILNEVLNNDD